MQYRDLGRTGIEVSALAFGCMRFPKTDDGNLDHDKSLELLRRAYELGINYFDTAYIYDKGDSERVIRDLLRQVPRDKVYIADKNPIGHKWYRIPGDEPTGKCWRRHLEEMLERLGTDYLDVCHFHDTQAVTFRIIVKAPRGPFEEALKAKEEGLIRHIGISCHDTPSNMIEVLEMGEEQIEVVVLQYNLLDRKNEPVIEYCREKGIGVTVMGPVGGGRLIHPSEVYQKAVSARSTPEVAIRFVLANPGVSSAMSGMNSMEQLEENVRAASEMGPLTQEELERINTLQKENARLLQLYCTGCGYCMPCPNGVNIPENFSALNLLKVHGLEELAKQQYKRLGEASAENCVECGECAGRCPQDIDIQSRLKEVASALGSS